MKKQFLISCTLLSPMSVFGGMGGGRSVVSTNTLPTPTATATVPSNFASIPAIVSKAHDAGVLNDVIYGAITQLGYVQPSNPNSAWVSVGQQLAQGTAATSIVAPSPAGSAQSSKRSVGRLGGRIGK